MQVWCSEDATRGLDRIEYNPSTNTLVGFVRPLTENGIPRTTGFEVTSASEMERILREEEVAGSIYCFMAQPMAPRSAPFCLMLAGTNGKFNHEDVLRRWKWIKKESLKNGVEVLGFSSDGDEKLLKAMRLITFPENLSNPPQFEDWFHADLRPEVNLFVMQDFVHLIAKLNCRLKKASVSLPMGDYNASTTHLRVLIREHSKDQHGLTEGDIDIKDKMNYRAPERLCRQIVTDLLTELVPESRGTVCYLEVMRDSTKAFLDRSLHPLERIELIWKCTFFLRIWRQWLLKNKYSICFNFVTLNAYHSMELNAHVLIQLLRYLRDTGKPTSCFRPWELGSQPCEGFFRRARSLTSTTHTATNFTVLDFLRRAMRIDLLNEIPTKIQGNYTFPSSKRVMKSESEFVPFDEFPSDEEIIAAVDKGRRSALKMVRDLGMDMPDHAANAFIDFSDPIYEGWLWTEEDEAAVLVDREYLNTAPNQATNQCQQVEQQVQDEHQLPSDDVQSETEESNDAEEDLCIISSGAIGLRTFDHVDIHQSSPLVVVADSDGRKAVVAKKSLLWAKTNSCPLLNKSADRNTRVQTRTPTKHSMSHTQGPGRRPGRAPTVENTVELTDWCLFRRGKKKIIGRVISFRYMTKPITYTGTSALVKPTGRQRKIGVQCLWYSVNDDSELVLEREFQNEYVDLKKNYISTLPRPLKVNNMLTLSLAAYNAYFS